MKMEPKRLVWILWYFWLAGGLLPSFFSFRYLYADGAPILLEILDSQSFFFMWPGREASHAIYQWLTVLAIELGVTDIRVLAGGLGICTMLIPTLIHGLTLWILLRKKWELPAFLYLTMLWLLKLYAGLMCPGESHLAVAFFLLSTVIAFTCAPGNLASWAAIGLIGLLSFWLYEFWFFYAALSILFLAWKLKFGFSSMTVGGRLLAEAVIAIMGVSVLLNLSRLLGSSSNPNQNSLLQMLSGTTLPIYLALITTWYLGVCGHVWLIGHPEYRFSSWVPSAVRTRLLGLFLVALLGLSAYQYATMVRYSYPFRVLNLMLPLLYIFWLFVSVLQKRAWKVPRACHQWLVLLTVALLIHETRTTMGWRQYLAWEGGVTRTSDQPMYVAQPPDTPLARTWIYPWTQSAQSFLVQAIRSGSVAGIAYDPNAGWNPYGPGHEDLILSLADRYGIRIE